MAIGDILTTPESGYTRYLFTNEIFEYSSGWSNNGTSDKISSTVGDTIKFNFYGDSIYILVHSWSNRGKMSISIDGKTPIEYNGNQGVNDNNYVAFIANELDEKWHDVTITVISTMGTLRAVDVKGSIAPYDESVRPQSRLALKNSLDSKVYSLSEKTLIPLPDSSPKNMILHGIEAGKEIKLDEAFDKVFYILENNHSNVTDLSLLNKSNYTTITNIGKIKKLLIKKKE